MKRIRRILRKKDGTTLVEMLVTMALFSMMLAMVAAGLSSVSKVFVQIQKTQYAQSILDTAMTELRTQTSGTCDYIKIYDNTVGNADGIENCAGSSSGNTLEFVNNEGYAVVLSTDGCQTTDIYIAENKTGQASAEESGQLLTRYYFRNSTDGTYSYRVNGTPAARAVATVFGKGFYMKNYIEVTYAFPDGVNHGDKTDCILATVTLYSDKALTQVVAQDSQILEFRDSVTRKDDVTALARTGE